MQSAIAIIAALCTSDPLPGGHAQNGRVQTGSDKQSPLRTASGV